MKVTGLFGKYTIWGGERTEKDCRRMRRNRREKVFKTDQFLKQLGSEGEDKNGMTGGERSGPGEELSAFVFEGEGDKQRRGRGCTRQR